MAENRNLRKKAEKDERCAEIRIPLSRHNYLYHLNLSIRWFMEKICIVKRRNSISNGLRQGSAFMPVNNREVYGGTDYEFENLTNDESDKTFI